MRYVTPTRPPRGRVSACLWMCARIGFAFFKPIIYQSCPPRFPIPNPILQLARRQNGKGEEEGPVGLRPVVSGRKIMSLFKDRKFSFGRAWEIDFRTLSNALFAPSCVRRQQCTDFILYIKCRYIIVKVSREQHNTNATTHENFMRLIL